MQFSPSAVQMVGLLFGIDTTAPDDTAGAFVDMAALALAIAVFASALASAFASALALAVATLFAVVCFWSLSSLLSSRCSCCFKVRSRHRCSQRSLRALAES